MRMIRKIMMPAIFLAGFLTAVIMGIKVIGVINMLLITKVLILNMAVLLGKLFYGKLHGLHGSPPPYHHHHHPPHYYGSHSYADSRADSSSLPYRRNFNAPSFASQPGFPLQNFYQSTYPNQIPLVFDQPQSAFPQNFNQPSITPQQPPTNFQSQPHNSNPFGGIQIHIPQQVPTAPAVSNQVRQQPQNQAPLISRFSSPSDPNLREGMQPLSTAPAAEIQMNDLQELPRPTIMSPLDILNDALARMGEKAASGESPSLARFKRKSPSHHRLHLNLLKPFSS
jgi:hypothetical protein